MTSHQRMIAAAVLIAIAALLPTVAWYVTGTREAVRRAHAATENALARLGAEVEREAERLGTRLEDLRASESARPFFHYQTLYRDPRGAAEGLSVTPSPLTSGPTDPLVQVHFQMDESGTVNLPAVSERFPELTASTDYAALCDFLAELQGAVLTAEGSRPVDQTADDERVLTMSAYEWEQIALAESVYASITGRGEGDAGPPPGGSTPGRVVIRVSPLRWYTMILGSGPSLAALREVHTPSGVVLQGFGIEAQAVSQWLAGGTQILQFMPAANASTEAVTALVADTGWALATASPAVFEEARVAGREIVGGFRRTFSIVAAAVFLAAAAVVWILLQTDRLARQRARFAAAAAHELKTPLSSLLLHAEMLAEGLGDPNHRSRYASTVTAEAGRLGRVVSNMLDLAKLERGALTTHPQPGDLGSVVSNCVERCRRRLEAAGLEIRAEIPDDLPQAVFDDDAVAQILDNLLDNAEKHTRSADRRELTIEVGATGDHLHVEIADSGPGVSRLGRRKLFRPFDRPPSADRTAGLGLGLALARSLARAQGGDLRLADDDRPGARFVLTLPKAERRASQA